MPRKETKASALSVAVDALAQSKKDLADKCSEFDREQSPQAWQAVLAARAEHERLTRVLELAQAAADAEAAEQLAAERAEAERVRLIALAETHQKIERNNELAIEHGTALAGCLKAALDLACEANILGDPSQSYYGFCSSTNQKLGATLYALSLSHSNLHIE